MTGNGSILNNRKIQISVVSRATTFGLDSAGDPTLRQSSGQEGLQICHRDSQNWTKSDVRAVLRLRSSRVRVAVGAWWPIRFPIALDGGGLCLEIILSRRALWWGARHVDSIVLAF
jgi:hypothetical protein